MKRKLSHTWFESDLRLVLLSLIALFEIISHELINLLINYIHHITGCLSGILPTGLNLSIFQVSDEVLLPPFEQDTPIFFPVHADESFASFVDFSTRVAHFNFNW